MPFLQCILVRTDKVSMEGKGFSSLLILRSRMRKAMMIMIMKEFLHSRKEEVGKGGISFLDLSIARKYARLA